MLGKYLNEKNIGRISLVNMLIVIFVLTAAMILYIVRQANTEFEAERAQIVKSFMESKKSILSNEINRLFDFVDYNTERTKENMTKEMVKHVDDSVDEANRLYRILGPGKKSASEIVEFLKSYKWEYGKKFLYIIDSKGTVIYHPSFASGKSLYNYVTPYGVYPIREEINAAFKKGRAIIDNSFPTDSGIVHRTVYVRKLGLFDWYVASAYDENDVRSSVQSQIISRVKSVRFDDTGHYFIMDTSGVGIAMPGNAQLEGQNLADVTDDSDVHYYRDLLTHSLQDNDYFSFYKQSYKDWSKNTQAVSHCKVLEQWGWVLCGTVQIDDLTPIISGRNAALKQKLVANETYSLLMFIIAAIIATAISWYFSTHVEKIFSKYKKDIENRNRDLEELNLELTNQLYTDHLTGLPNRNKLVNDLNSVKNPILILLNIDAFKKINETYGFIIGDFVLIDVGEKISSFKCEPEPQCYKFHGNEYAMLIDCEMSKDALAAMMTRMADYLDFTVKYDELEIEIDISITAGVSAEKGNVFEKAGMAMRIAEKKKQPFMIYDSTIDMVDEYENDIRWTKVVKRALSENHLVPFFQPIANSKTGTVEKFECLVRIIDGDDVITPFQFLDIIKKTKLYQHVTKRMMTKSFEMFAENEFTFTINLSIEDIVDESTSKFILDMLKTSGIASRVIFELLESEGIESFGVINDFIKEIKKTGAKVAIDDFGSGYSNFVYLSELNVDIIKIDGSLIKNIDHDRQSQIIVETIIKFANQLNIKTVAEFVHSESVKQKVIEMGIDYIQGYHVGKPTESISDYL